MGGSLGNHAEGSPTIGQVGEVLREREVVAVEARRAPHQLQAVRGRGARKLFLHPFLHRHLWPRGLVLRHDERGGPGRGGGEDRRQRLARGRLYH